jgi:CheY-like chemotaxis protein
MPSSRSDLQGIHVLLVDDAEPARQAFRALLESWGALVTAVTAADAVGTALRADIIVCDVETAEAAGSGFLDRLSRRHARGDRPLPMLGLLPPGVGPGGRARAPVFDRLLEKPVSGADLHDAVRALARP